MTKASSTNIGRKITRAVGLAVCALVVAACATDKYSFVRYGQTVEPSTGQYDARRDPVLTDVVALNYASSVVAILRAKYTGARITREASSTAQLGLAAATAYGAAFNYSKSTLAVLGLTAAGIPDLQKLFGAKERAQTYQDAIRLIEEAEVEYLSYNQRPSATELTQNGVTLFQRVTSSIHVVEKTLAGNLPSVRDMQKATENMTPEGATATAPGAPAFNNTPANPDSAAAITNRKRYEGTIKSTLVRLPDRPAPIVEDVISANSLRRDIRKIDEPGAEAMLTTASRHAVLKPEIDANPRADLPARDYVYHLIEIASRKGDGQAQLKAWRGIIPARPIVAPTPAPAEPSLPTDKSN